MKKSELKFKCVVPNKNAGILIRLALKSIGLIENAEDDYTHYQFFACDRGLIVTTNADAFCSWSEPLMSYEDAIKLIARVEEPAKVFDINLQNEVKPSFTINTYDCDGDLVKKCITIHIDKFAMQFQHRDELDEFIKNLQKISDEIAANYEQW